MVELMSIAFFGVIVYYFIGYIINSYKEDRFIESVMDKLTACKTADKYCKILGYRNYYDFESNYLGRHRDAHLERIQKILRENAVKVSSEPSREPSRWVDSPSYPQDRDRNEEFNDFLTYWDD